MKRAGGRNAGLTVEAGTSLKCQRHHNSREAKERLLAGLEPAKKSQLATQEQIKFACTFYRLPSLPPPCTRLSVGGEDERLKGRTSRALFVQRREPQKFPARQKDDLLCFHALILSRHGARGREKERYENRQTRKNYTKLMMCRGQTRGSSRLQQTRRNRRKCVPVHRDICACMELKPILEESSLRVKPECRRKMRNIERLNIPGLLL